MINPVFYIFEIAMKKVTIQKQLEQRHMKTFSVRWEKMTKKLLNQMILEMLFMCLHMWHMVFNTFQLLNKHGYSMGTIGE